MDVPSRRAPPVARPVVCVRCGRRVEGSSQAARPASPGPLCAICFRTSTPVVPSPGSGTILALSGGSSRAPLDPPMPVPDGHSPIRCFQCGRRGHIASRQLLLREPREILCPRCRAIRSRPPNGGARAPGAPRPGGMTGPSVPTRAPLVGRPPMILARSKAEAGLAAAAATPARPVRSFFPVKCFVCGRAGRLPVRPEIPLRLEDVICPTCRQTGGSGRTLALRGVQRLRNPRPVVTPP
jgi:DNA-directed RNA polymerase subunit RPC12/RpoP